MSRFGALGMASGLQGLPTSMKYGASSMQPYTDPETGETKYQMPNMTVLGAVGGRSSSLLVLGSESKSREWNPTHRRLF